MRDFPRIVTAASPGQEDRFYLIDRELEFIPEVKSLLDQKVIGRCSPNTTKALCTRLRWYYQFLNQRKLRVLDVKSPDLSDFVLWLSSPYRFHDNQPIPLQASTINQILSAVADLYKFLVRHRYMAESPVVYKSVRRRGKAVVDKDLLAHTRTQRGHIVQQMEIRLKEPKSIPKTVLPADFEQFVNRIHIGTNPGADPSGFRDRLMTLLFRESGFRCGEMLGIHMRDLDFEASGVHVRFRPDNINGSRAKAGYGRDRFVHLPLELFGFLDVYLTEVWVNANRNSDYLWLVLKRNAINGDRRSTFGTPLNRTAVNQMFSYYSRQSGIKIHPHMLRHTHATDLVRSYLGQKEPVDWKFISDRLGHASVVTTMQNYVHLTKEDIKKAYDLYWQNKEKANAKRR